MPGLSTRSATTERLSRYLDKVLGGVADRIADRVAHRLHEDYISYMTTAEIMADEESADALREGERELREEGLPPAWEDVRQDLGLGKGQAHSAR